jgi:hypothetical protein
MRNPIQNAVVVALAAAGAALWPSPAPAQVEVATALGIYWPVGDWTQQSDGGTGFAPRRHQIPAALLGARLIVPTSKRLALEGTFAFSPSQVAVSTGAGIKDITAGVLLASARAVFKVATLVDGDPGDRMNWDLLLGAGAGVVHRGGSAWENTSGVTAPAITLSAAALTRLAGSVRLRFGVEDFVSWAQFDKGLPSQMRARVHHDIIGSLGVVVRLAGP